MSGVGARFERGHDVLWIRQQAVIVLAGDSPSELVRVRAPAAVYARAERFWRFDGHVIFERADWTSEADAAVIHLDAEERRVTLVELRGGARVVARGHDPGSIETMSARDITLDYGADGRELGQALLAGRAAVRLRGAPGEATRRVAAEWMDVRLAPGVGRISHLTARDAVEVSLPGAGATPARRIRARALDVVGSADESLQTARFTGDVEFWETLRTPAGAGRGERLLRAQTLEARFAAALGELEDARFTGAVELRDGELRADAGAARYQVAAGLVELLPGTAPADPRVTDERVIVTARRIELDVATRRLIAEGTVRCELRPQPRPAAPAPAETPRLPQLLDHRRPAYATAARLAYDSQRAVAEFAGSATLFQDDTAIQGETVTLDERRGDLTAVGGVRSRTRFEQTDPEAKARERRDSVGTADRLEYDDALRRLRYLDKALLRDPDGQMRADRIDVYLRETAEAVDRIEAFGSVALRLDRRAAWGDRLTYVEREGRYVVHGTPVRIVEDLGTECRETLGRTLTFQKAADTITVDGNAEHRTRTKTGGKCPELRLQ